MTGLEIVLALAGLAVAGASVWFQRQELWPPKRRLELSALPAAALAPTLTSAGTNVKVFVDDIESTDAHTRVITARNTGRYDITNETFHNDDPIGVDVESPILVILDTTMSPRPGSPPEVSFAGSVLQIGPGLIPRGQELTIQLLADGAPAEGKVKPTTTSGHLIDTIVADGTRRGIRRPLAAARVVALVAGTIAVTAAIVSAYFDAVTFDGSFTVSPDNGRAGSEFIVEGDGYEDFAVITVRSNSDYEDVAEAQADKNGRFKLTVEVPDDLAPGYVEFTVISSGSDSSHFQYFDYAVTE